MLDVILGEDIYNVAAVVTRYFGGYFLEQEVLCEHIPGSLQAGLAASTVIGRTPWNFYGRRRIIQGSARFSILPENRNSDP